MILLLLFYLAKAQSHRSGNFRGIFRNDVAHLGKKSQPKNLLSSTKCCTNASVNKAIYYTYMYTYMNTYTIKMGQRRTHTQPLKLYLMLHLGNNKAKRGGNKIKGNTRRQSPVLLQISPAAG